MSRVAGWQSEVPQMQASQSSVSRHPSSLWSGNRDVSSPPPETEELWDAVESYANRHVEFAHRAGADNGRHAAHAKQPREVSHPDDSDAERPRKQM